jgi:hypothetical protein
MSTSSEEIRLGAGSRRRTALTIGAVLCLTVTALAGTAVAWSRRAPAQPYSAEIRYAQWDTPRRLTVALRLVRSDGKPAVTHRCPDLTLIRADGTEFHLTDLSTTYGPTSADDKRMDIAVRALLTAADGRPQRVRLRLVSYESPPWWKQLLFHAKPTDDDEQRPIMLPGSEVDLAAAAPFTASR